MQLVFWIYFGVMILILIILLALPFEKDEEREESNPHFAKLCTFGVFIFVGFAITVVFYFLVVVLHQDLAIRLLKT